MDVRRTTYVLLLVLMLSVAVPVAMGGDSDAAEQSDVIVNVDGSGDSITLDMESGTSKTATLYITNNSDSYLSLDVPTYDSDLISSSAKITVNGTESNLIYPKGDSDGRHIAVVTITVSVDRLTDTQTVEGNLTLRFTDVTVESTDGSNVFERQVPFTVNVNSVYTSEGSYNQFFGLFPNTLPAPLNEPWFTAVVTLVLWIVITIVVCELVIPQLTKIVGSRKTATEKKKLTQTLTKTISVLMFVVAVNECLNIIGTNAEIMSMVSTWSLVLYVLIGSVLAWQVYIFLVTAIINGLDDAVDVDGIDSSLIPLFRLIGKVVICVFAATIILAAFGVDLAGIMVSAGVITLGITFGAQEIISQFFSGIVLLSTRPFKKGDYISLNGTTYIVHKVRIMYTEFENWDRDQIVTMPNNAVTSATMINYTKGDPRDPREGADDQGRQHAPPCDKGQELRPAEHQAHQLPGLRHRVQTGMLRRRLRPQRPLRRPDPRDHIQAVQGQRRGDPVQQAPDRHPERLRRQEETGRQDPGRLTVLCGFRRTLKPFTPFSPTDSVKSAHETTDSYSLYNIKECQQP